MIMQARSVRSMSRRGQGAGAAARGFAPVAAATIFFVTSPVSAQPTGEPSPQQQPFYPPQPYPPQSYGQPQAVAGPRVITDWNEGEPIPRGYRPVQRTRAGLVAGGAS